MEAHIERIVRDLKEELEELFDYAYEMGKADQESEDVVKIEKAYDKGQKGEER